MKTTIREININDINNESILAKYKGKHIQDTGLVYAPYIPSTKYIIEDKKDWWTTFTFRGYDSHAIADWAFKAFGQTNFDLKGPDFIKIYLVDPEQITALRLAWDNIN